MAEITAELPPPLARDETTNTASKTEIENKPHLPFHKDLGSDMAIITLRVGPEPNPVEYRLHKNILTSRVPYFNKMFNSTFTEAQTLTASFPEDKPEAFDVLLEWIYYSRPGTGVAVRGLGLDEDWAIEKFKEGLKGNWDVVEVYALAEKFCLVEMMDRVTEVYRKCLYKNELSPSIETFKEAYQKTSRRSGLRKFLSRFLAHSIFKGDKERFYTKKTVNELFEGVPDLMEDVIAIMWGGEGKSKKYWVSPDYGSGDCRFHVHGHEECYLVQESNDVRTGLLG